MVNKSILQTTRLIATTGVYTLDLSTLADEVYTVRVITEEDMLLNHKLSLNK